MATVTGLNSFTAGTPAKASEVNTNFSIVKTFVEGLSTGANIDTSAISESKIASNAVTSAKILNNTILMEDLAVSLQRFLVPVGSISAYAGATAPTGWLLCDGTTTSGYTALAALVGATTPDLRGKFPIGDNAVTTLLGAGGSSLITTANMPIHSHANTATGATTVTVDSGGSHSHTASSNSTGSHQHGAVVDQLDSTTAHGHGTDGTFMSGTSATPEGTSTAYTNFDGTHSHTITVDANGIHAHTATGSTTVTMTNANAGSGTDYFPPFVALNFIIKHD